MFSRMISGAAGAWLAVSMLAGTGAGPADAGQPEAAPAPMAGGRFADAEALLTALESADRGLRRLQADVEFIKVFQPDGDVHRRIGVLWFASDPGADGGPERRRFAVRFDEFYRDDVLFDDVQSYAFDGQWLLEKHPGTKEFAKRQVVRAGERFDPLKIGEGPFPLPIGQKKDAILAEYVATLVPTDDGLKAPEGADADPEEQARNEVVQKNVRGSVQLKLVPRADAPKESEFSEVRLWYKEGDGGRLLPRAARTVKATRDPLMRGDVCIVTLINVRLNDAASMDEAVFDVSVPQGWEGNVEELPKEGPAGGRPNGR